MSFFNATLRDAGLPANFTEKGKVIGDITMEAKDAETVRKNMELALDYFRVSAPEGHTIFYKVEPISLFGSEQPAWENEEVKAWFRPAKN